jgi:hypothetical protein
MHKYSNEDMLIFMLMYMFMYSFMIMYIVHINEHELKYANKLAL